MRISISIVVKKGLKTCMFAGANSKQVMWTTGLYTGISDATTCTQNLGHAVYLAHHLEEKGFVLGFIYLEILDLLESFESI